jgi:hypothetical protein
MTISAEPHLAFDRGRILARGASGTRLTQKIRPGAQRRCGDFLGGTRLALAAEAV